MTKERGRLTLWCREWGTCTWMMRTMLEVVRRAMRRRRRRRLKRTMRRRLKRRIRRTKMKMTPSVVRKVQTAANSREETVWAEARYAWVLTNKIFVHF